MSDNTSPTPRVREQLRSLEGQGEDYIWRTAKAAGDAWDECERRLSAAVAELQRERDENGSLQLWVQTEKEARDTLQARVRVLESAGQRLRKVAMVIKHVEGQGDVIREVCEAISQMNDALKPPATPPADPQGDPYRDALAELVDALGNGEAYPIGPYGRTIQIESPTRLQKATNRARALLSGTDEGKS